MKSSKRNDELLTFGLVITKSRQGNYTITSKGNIPDLEVIFLAETWLSHTKKKIKNAMGLFRE